MLTNNNAILVTATATTETIYLTIIIIDQFLLVMHHLKLHLLLFSFIIFSATETHIYSYLFPFPFSMEFSVITRFASLKHHPIILSKVRLVVNSLFQYRFLFSISHGNWQKIHLVNQSFPFDCNSIFGWTGFYADIEIPSSIW